MINVSRVFIISMYHINERNLKNYEVNVVLHKAWTTWKCPMSASSLTMGTLLCLHNRTFITFTEHCGNGVIHINLFVWIHSLIHNQTIYTKTVCLLGKKGFSKTSFHLRINGAEKRTETRRRWKNARRLPDICKNAKQMSGSLLAFFHPLDDLSLRVAVGVWFGTPVQTTFMRGLWRKLVLYISKHWAFVKAPVAVSDMENWIRLNSTPCHYTSAFSFGAHRSDEKRWEEDRQCKACASEAKATQCYE